MYVIVPVMSHTYVLVITYQKYNALMEEKASFLDKEEENRRLFKIFDGVNNGFLQLEDFLLMAEKHVPSLNKASIQSLFCEADRDHDGKLSYRDFQRLLTLTEASPQPPLTQPRVSVPSQPLQVT